MIRAAEVHARIGSAWPNILSQLGIAEKFLRKKPGPCPACGGRDRYTFDNRKGRGDFYCRHCGSGDGFELLKRINGWTFSEARRRVIAAAGLSGDTFEPMPPRPAPVTTPANPTRRIHELRRGACAVVDCADAVAYLESRRLWPLPEGCTLRAHAAVEYFDDERRRVGRFPALVADVRDVAADLVTAHITYLSNGRKLAPHEPRKMLSPLVGREACAVRLQPLQGSTLGIAEGIETALSASILEGVPVWAALNAGLLAKFEPPAGVTELLIFADRDEAGLQAAADLSERIQGRVQFRIRTPRAPANDWNDFHQTGKPYERDRSATGR